jgi:hypothetical protein
MEALGLLAKSPAAGARGAVGFGARVGFGAQGRSPWEAYVLTPAGRELEPALHALGQWGFRFLSKPDPADRKELAWGLFALKRRYRGTGKPLSAEFRCEGRVFQYRLAGDRADLQEGSQGLPDVLLEADGDTFRALFFRGESAGALRAAKKLVCGGSEGKLGDLLKAFGLKA